MGNMEDYNKGSGGPGPGAAEMMPMTIPMGPVGPMVPMGAVPVEPVKPAKPKFRYEFVICFAWRDVAGQTVPQAGTAAATATPTMPGGK